MKLNLGCGDKILQGDGWVNVDLYPAGGVDRVANILHLDYPPESVDEILLSHVIEHIHPDDFPPALASWVAMLKRGGRMIIEAPDMKQVCLAYAHNAGGIRDKWWKKVFYGPDRREGQPHLNCFHLSEAVEILCGAGLVVTRARPWGDGSDPNNPTHTAGNLPAYNFRVEAVKP